MFHRTHLKVSLKLKMISYFTRFCTNEFVLNAKGKPIKYDSSTSEFLSFFSIEDVYQGHLGNCFLIGTIMGLLRNQALLAFLIPMDNAFRSNMKIGAYHFRLWKLGDWHDVVVDDFLPVDTQYDPIFSRNLSFRNEFWIALFEKAAAKFVGAYETLNGGCMESAALTLSGGIHTTYYTALSRHLTNRTAIKDEWARNHAKFIISVYGELDVIVPTVDDLFFIMQTALNQNNLVGVATLLVGF